MFSRKTNKVVFGIEIMEETVLFYEDRILFSNNIFRQFIVSFSDILNAWNDTRFLAF